MRAIHETLRIGERSLVKGFRNVRHGIDNFFSPPPTEEELRDAKRVVFSQTVLPEDIRQQRKELIDKLFT